MNYTLIDLISAIVVGFLGTGLGYIIGNVRGKNKSREEILPRLPFIIYNRES